MVWERKRRINHGLRGQVRPGLEEGPVERGLGAWGLAALGRLQKGEPPLFGAGGVGGGALRGLGIGHTLSAPPTTPASLPPERLTSIRGHGDLFLCLSVSLRRRPLAAAAL